MAKKGVGKLRKKSSRSCSPLPAIRQQPHTYWKSLECLLLPLTLFSVFLLVSGLLLLVLHYEVESQYISLAEMYSIPTLYLGIVLLSVASLILLVEALFSCMYYCVIVRPYRQEVEALTEPNQINDK